MYCNFAKSQAFPFVFKIPSGTQCFKPSQKLKFSYFSNGVYSKPSNGVKQVPHSNELCLESSENLFRRKSRNFSCGFCQKGSENHIGAERKVRNFSSGVHFHSGVQRVSLFRRNFSNGYARKVDGGGNGVRDRKTLPWIAAYKNKRGKPLEKVPIGKPSSSSWEESANEFLMKNGVKLPEEKRESRNQIGDMIENKRGSVEREEIGVVEEVEDEVVDDPRWDKIKTRYRRVTDLDVRSEKPEVRRWTKQDNGFEKPESRRWNKQDDRFEKPVFRMWNKQEEFGRKTWKEATVSTIPRMSGEGVYGVGPVLAALSTARREFYVLYVQEGLDLSSNNRKKKDKKGFEKVLKIAEKIGLTVKEASKHDLNMIVDNRPHQGLVLDASPLEMVSIRELDPVSVEGEMGPLWVALDEITDPQNLGAIVRSTYFFGAAGVILCAKNSAPLTGVVSKASAGSLELMELRSCKNMMQFLSSSAENGWRVIGGSVSSKALPLNEIPAGAPTILVLGSEGTGLRPLVERSCTELVRIPGNIPVDISARGAEYEKAEEVDRSVGEEFQSFLAVESLNVSVAAGVLLHHLIGRYNNCHSSDTQASIHS